MQKAALFSLVLGLAVSSYGLARALAPKKAWPEAALRAVEPGFRAGFGVRRVFLDAGHGAPGNPGNKSAFCREEQSFTASLAEALAESLARTGHFEVRLSRSGDALVPYAERVRAAESWPADALVSLHSDVRGKTESWQPSPEASCLRSRNAPGFAVLWSDFGEGGLGERRLSVARAVALQMTNAGFLAYAGGEYGATYSPDVQQPGVFVDRHPSAERVFVLWRPSVPSVIIETHNALDDREALRWEEPAVREAFAASVASALAAAL